MPLPAAKVEWLEQFFTAFDEGGHAALNSKKISKKSYDFACDQRARFRDYRERMFLSEKQESWLRNIYDEMNTVDELDKDPSGSARLRDDHRASKYGREQGPGRPYTKEEFDDDIPF